MYDKVIEFVKNAFVNKIVTSTAEEMDATTYESGEALASMPENTQFAKDWKHVLSKYPGLKSALSAPETYLGTSASDARKVARRVL